MEYEIQHEDLVPYHNTTINMAEKLKSFYIDHVPRQQNAHADALASLAASTALPAGATAEVLVHSRDLYCLKFAFEGFQKEIFKLMRFLGLQQIQNPRIDDFHSSTFSYTTYCLMILSRQL